MDVADGSSHHGTDGHDIYRWDPSAGDDATVRLNNTPTEAADGDGVTDYVLVENTNDAGLLEIGDFDVGTDLIVLQETPASVTSVSGTGQQPDWKFTEFTVTYTNGNEQTFRIWHDGSATPNVRDVFSDDPSIVPDDAGDDSIDAGAGDDIIVIDDGFGSDSISGGDDTDTLDFSAMDRAVTVTFTSDDAGFFTDGIDTATFNEIENVILSDHDDVLDASDDTNGVSVDGGDGNDSISGGHGRDTLFGGDGDDTIFDGDAGDTIDGGEGSDTILLDDDDNAESNVIVDTGTSGTDTLVLFDGNGTFRVQGDFSAASSGIEIIDGSSASGELLGTRDSAANFDFSDITMIGVDEIAGTNNDDTIIGSDGADSIDGGKGDDILSGGAGDDTIATGSGRDTVDGGEGSDTILLDDNDGGQSNVIIDTGSTGTDTLVLFDGNGTFRVQGDFSAASTGIEVIDGSSASGELLGTNDSAANFDFSDITMIGVDEIAGTNNADTIIGSSADDTITGGRGADSLSGGDGSDSISGGDGDDILVGGGDGSHTALIHMTFQDGASGTATDSSGNGHDGVYKGDAAAGGDDGSGNTGLVLDGTGDFVEIPNDSSFELTEGTIAIAFNAANLSGTQAMVSRDSTNFDNGGHFNLYVKSDGSVEVRMQTDSSSHFATSAPGVVTAGVDHHAAVTFGPEGMTLYVDGVAVDTDSHTGGLEGNSEPFTIGAGQIRSGDGSSDGVDEFFEGRLDDFAVFDSALSASDVASIAASGAASVIGDDGSDTLDGGAGADSLFGGAGDDSLSGGADNDVLDGGAGNDTLDGGTGADTIDGGAGDDVIVLSDDFGADSISGGEGSDTVDLSGVTDAITVTFSGTDAGSIDDGSDTATFDVEDMIFGDADTTVDASRSSEAMTIETGSGDDVITGTDRSDSIDTGDGADTVQGGAGSDTIAGGSGNDSLSGGDGADTISGGDGDDILVGGGDGSHTALIHMTFQDGASATATDSSGNGHDGTYKGDAAAGGDDGSGNTGLVVDGSGDFVEIPNDSSFELTEGTIAIAFNAANLSGNQTLVSRDSRNFDDGGHFNVFVKSDGSVQVRMQTDSSSHTATSDAGVVTAGTDHHVAVTFGPGGMTLYVDGVVADTDSHTGGLDGNSEPFTIGAGQIRSDDGSSDGADEFFEGRLDDFAVFDSALSASDVASIAASGAASVIGGDTLDGGAGNDTLTGSDGDDSLSGGADDDTLDGGTGADTIDGGTGDDVIRLSDSFGADSISGGDGTDTLDLSGHTTGVTVAFVSGGDGTVSDGTDTATFDGIESIVATDADDEINVFHNHDPLSIDAGDGNDTISGLRGSTEAYGGDGNDTISGATDSGSGTSTIFGGAGDDSIDGMDGTDIIYGGLGNDTIEAGEERNAGDDDTIFGGDGDDVITSVETDSRSNDSLYGGADDDTITVVGGDSNVLDGGTGNDTLTSGTGSDSLDGGEGDDVLTGGAGTDTITTGTGSDTVVVTVGSGDDVVTDFDAATDRLDVSALGVTADAVAITEAANGTQTLDFGDETVTVPPGTVDTSSPAAQFSSLVALGVPPCFAPGTRILTESGPVAVEDLSPGVRIMTRDHGLQTLRWIGRREQPLDGADDRARPVLIREGAFGNGLPERDLVVSPQHRMLLAGPRVAAQCGTREVLALAKGLLGLAGVRILRGRRDIVYFALLFDRHEVIYAEGCPTESFRPGPVAMEGLTPEVQAEIMAVYPDLRDDPVAGLGPAARPLLTRREAVMLVGAHGPAVFDGLSAPDRADQPSEAETLRYQVARAARSPGSM